MQLYVISLLVSLLSLNGILSLNPYFSLPGNLLKGEFSKHLHGNIFTVKLSLQQHRHTENKEAIGDSQRGFTKGKLCLTNWVAFNSGAAALMDMGRARDVI